MAGLIVGEPQCPVSFTAKTHSNKSRMEIAAVDNGATIDQCKVTKLIAVSKKLARSVSARKEK